VPEHHSVDRYGQLAGAYYSVEAILDEWVQALAWNEKISVICNELIN